MNFCGFRHLSESGIFGSGKATRPCACGYAGELGTACPRKRGANCVTDYQAKLSGPLLDRIDLHLDVGAVSASDLSLPPASEGSEEVAARVAEARARQLERYDALVRIRTNADVDGQILEDLCAPDQEGRALLNQAADKMRLSARGYFRVLRVARTLADLDGARTVRRPHVAEALAYRAALSRAETLSA